jgi:hypothetical protein
MIVKDDADTHYYAAGADVRKAVNKLKSEAQKIPNTSNVYIWLLQEKILQIFLKMITSKEAD